MDGGKPQAAREAVHLVKTLAQTITATHASGVLHRDLKPSNVLVMLAGQLKVTDFGLAKLLDRGQIRQVLTTEDAVLGTPSYMAPEQQPEMQVRRPPYMGEPQRALFAARAAQAQPWVRDEVFATQLSAWSLLRG